MGWRDAVPDVQAQARRLAEAVGSGTAGAAQVRPPVAPATQGGQGPAMKITRLPFRGVDLRELGGALARWYESQNLAAEVDRDGSAVRIQCRSHGARSIAGAGLALTVVLRPEPDGLAVELGAGKWKDKGVAAGIGLLTLSGGVGLIPLASSAWGGWQQAKMPARTIEFLRATAPSFMSSSAPPEPPPVVPVVHDVGGPPGPAVTTSSSPGSSAAGSRVRVDVNRATVSDLRDLAGLPPAAAEQVVAERHRLGGFTSLSEVEVLLRGRLQPHQLAAVRTALALAPVDSPAPRARTDGPPGRAGAGKDRPGRVLDFDDDGSGSP